MGSGSLAAMAVFESRFRPGMEKEEAMNLVADAIESGIFNDLGSGSNVDLTVIWNDLSRPAEVLRNWRKPAVKLAMTGRHIVAAGTTRIVAERVRDFRKWVSVLEEAGVMEE
jgi:20S proteasome subunit beta 2